MGGSTKGTTFVMPRVGKEVAVGSSMDCRQGAFRWQLTLQSTGMWMLGIEALKKAHDLGL